MKVYFLDFDFGLSWRWLELLLENRVDLSCFRAFFDVLFEILDYHVFFLLGFFLDHKFLPSLILCLFSVATTIFALEVILLAVGDEQADYLPEVDEHHYLESGCIVQAKASSVF